MKRKWQPAALGLCASGRLSVTRFMCLVLLIGGTASKAPAQAGIITTYAGAGPNSKTALSAEIIEPQSVAVDISGNIYIAVPDMYQVFRADRSGNFSLVAGNGTPGFSGDGELATKASLSWPEGVAVDAHGNVFIADTDNLRIRRVDAETGDITSVAGDGNEGYSGDGGLATSASLNRPTGVAMDANGNLFVADTYNQRIRRVDATTGIITTVAGNGSLGFLGDGRLATKASLSDPQGVAVDANGNLFIADSGHNRIRRVDATTGIITTVAGDGSRGYRGDGKPATSASLYFPAGVAVDSSGNLFVADTDNQRIRRVDAKTRDISTVAGNGNSGYSGDGGPATRASLSWPGGVAVDSLGNLFIADTYNNRIRDVASAIINTTAGGGSGGDASAATSATTVGPWAVATDFRGDLFISDPTEYRVRRVNSETGIITTAAGDGNWGFSGDGKAATSASLTSPNGVAVDIHGNLFIADSSNDNVRRVDALTGDITTVAGDGNWGFSGDGGPATSASLNSPNAVAVDAQGNLFIADSDNLRIRRVDAVTGDISTVAGNGNWGFSGDGGPATSASLAWPQGVAVDAHENLFIADTDNLRVRRVDGSTGIITTVAGDWNWGYSGDGGLATSANLYWPYGVALDFRGNLFIADTANARIRRVDALSGIIITVAGDGNWGFSGDEELATSSSLNWPTGVAVAYPGSLFIADNQNNRVREITLPPYVALSPNELTFATQKVGRTSKPQVITLTDTGTANLIIVSFDLGGTDPGDFAWSTSGACEGGTPPGGVCHISVTFTPQEAGNRSATLTIFDSAPDSPQTVALSGTGSS